MPEYDNIQEPRSPLVSRRALLGGLAAASVAPWLLQGTPAHAAFTKLPSAAALPRQQHAAVLLDGDYVMVIGGQSAVGEPMDDVSLYAPDGAILQLASLNIPRYSHAAVHLSNDHILVLGGYGQGALDLVEKYNPSTNKWTMVKSLNLPRYNHTAKRLSEDQILIVGGYSQGILTSRETYTPDF